ncbi:fluoride efflux transporter CrcB [Aquimarina sp. 2304DJ70-9]|uniref:fluoride efflux transporter CrcB n=1 Tax=Aquimarina penaris TaxID=3231044 RepID=UPI003461BB83
MKQLLLVFIGGGTGSVARYLISKFLNQNLYNFPFGTLTVNIIGSLLIGVILGLSLKANSLSQNTVLLLATGFCGGFTTFSSFAYENQIMLKNGDLWSLFIYTAGSFILGLLAVFLGMFLSK